MRNFAALTLMLILANCSGAKDYCMGLGHGENTAEFQACEGRYKEFPMGYQYCKNKGITQPGNSLGACLTQAKTLEFEFNKDSRDCDVIAEAKQPEIKDKTQWIRQSDGAVVKEEEKVNVAAVMARSLYAQQCLKERGWKGNGWMDGK